MTQPLNRSPFRLVAIVIAIALMGGVTWQWRTATPDLSVFGTIIVAPDPSETTVEAYVIFPTTNSAPGLAHYTEHLAWLNSVGQRKDAINSHSNAWASHFTTGYWLSGSPEALPGILTTLADLFEPIDLDDSFAVQERDIIQREYDFRMAGNPAAQAAAEMIAFLYDGTALATSVIGTRDDIANLSYAAARDLHAQTHQPHLATIVITGPITAHDAHKALTAASWPMVEAPQTKVAPQTVALANTAETTLRFPEPTAAPRMLWRKVVDLPDPMPFDLLELHTILLNDLLETNLPGGLAGPLRFDAAIASSFDVTIWPMDEDTVEINISASPDRGVTLTDLRATFAQTLADVATTGIPQDTFDRVVDRFADVWPDWDDTEDSASWMAAYAVERAYSGRLPLPRSDLESLAGEMSLSIVDMILTHLSGEGRTATAFIGPKEFFE